MPWLKVLLLLAMVVAADQLAGWVLRHFYQRMQSGPEYATRYAAEDNKADLVIIGASRAQQQYNPLYIQDTLGITAYNAGRDGMSFFYNYSIFKCVVSRYTPKTIILDCEYGALKYYKASYERLSVLLPLYKNHPEIRDIVAMRHPFETTKLLSATYPFNSMLFKVALGNLSAGKKENESINGYDPLYGKLQRTAPLVSHKSNLQFDSTKLRLLDEMITTCQRKNIQLIFVCPPYYIKNIDENPTIAYFKSKAAAHQIPFLDYAADTFFLNRPHLWDDTVHVNYEGSKIFSARLAGDLKKLSQTK